MNRPQFFFRQKQIMEETTQNTEEPQEEVQVEEVEHEETVEQPKTENGNVCENCEGSGLADKKERGENAQIMCSVCEGSGRS